MLTKLVNDVFNRSVGILLPSALVDMPEHIHDKRIANRWRDALLRASIRADKLNELFFALGAAPEPAFFETKHPYDNKENYKWSFDFPGATELLITFDPRTKSEKKHDPLTITDGKGVNHVLSGTDPENWVPLTVAGPSLAITFVSDISNVDWGVKATITAPTTASDLTKTQRLLSFLVVKASTALIDVNTTDVDDDYFKWMSCPLFQNGDQFV